MATHGVKSGFGRRYNSRTMVSQGHSQNQNERPESNCDSDGPLPEQGIQERSLPMTQHWTAALSAQGAYAEGEDILHFGALEAELAAARSATVAVPLTHLGLLECAGEDAKSFLHNQLTSDINHLGPQSLQHSAWCSAKGRMLVSFLFYRHGDGYRALLSSDLVEATQKRLQMYVLRAKVSISRLHESHALIGIAGPDARAALVQAGLDAPTEAMHRAENARGDVLALSDQRFVVVIPAHEVQSVWTALTTAARPAGRLAWQWLDIRDGLPLICEATKEAFVPQMADFDRIGGVSFHKGCYPGQEIIARTQYLGKVKRHLYHLYAQAPMAAGMAVFSPDSPEHAVGTVVNAAPSPEGGHVALAVIQENFIDGTLTLETLEGPDLRLVKLE